jgi:iron donor protein CyaY
MANRFASEADYRKQILSTLDRVERAFHDVDPDLAECTLQFGALTIRLGDGTKCILSSQPSVQQLWMALAAKGVAYHFDWDPSSGRWLDDKGTGTEALAYLRSYLKEAAQLDLKL